MSFFWVNCGVFRDCLTSVICFVIRYFLLLLLLFLVVVVVVMTVEV